MFSLSSDSEEEKEEEKDEDEDNHSPFHCSVLYFFSREETQSARRLGLGCGLY